MLLLLINLVVLPPLAVSKDGQVANRSLFFVRQSPYSVRQPLHSVRQFLHRVRQSLHSGLPAFQESLTGDATDPFLQPRPARLSIVNVTISPSSSRLFPHTRQVWEGVVLLGLDYLLAILVLRLAVGLAWFFLC